ncbi:hypothetical protein KAFR_0K00270 [Kazachstania africana CBS 2517]|uniref:Signal recognition particle subunit SRP72 n=1 Tax=Kazachstania africana (strain ATCC 22294 / BCRC 22015 / CBS 2517 / CECT 1963 / NBRC 1671 / NRRL Y-8276) TaxID=1071382 RepID=H2B182_KAZAF|nr:hypothetical protein KAFR_0K00270 [Kazachstania africana CBS 2517]CCF60382.1 hypothetical protein KAFR_0K00270 [Kazachstania africana CBS 2517]
MARDSLTDLLGQLSVHSSHNEHFQVEKTCIELLNSGCANPNVVLKHCLVAIIKQDKYQQALKVLAKHKVIHEKYASQFRLERLYIYYKLNKVEEFEKLYSSIVTDDIDSLLSKSESQLSSLRGILHVRAQFCVKNGFDEEALKIYNYLASHNNNGQDDNVELLCNVRVPLTSSPELLSENPTELHVIADSHDLLFNQSMILSAQGNFEESIFLLEKALQMATSEDYKDDMNSIQLQLSYVYQLAGEKSKCKELLEPLLERLPAGTPLKLIATNNIKSFIDFSKYKTNFNLLARELNVEKLNSFNLQKFTYEQWSLFQRNCLFIHLFNNVDIQSKSTILSRTLSTYSKIVDNVVIEPYKTQARKLYHNAVNTIKSGTQGSVIGLTLLAVQLLVVEKEWDNAIRLCELFYNKSQDEEKQMTESKKTIIYVLFELYNVSNRNNSKSILLKKIMSSFIPTTSEFEFWKHIGFQYLTVNDPRNAKNIFKIISEGKDDTLIKGVLNEEDFSIEKGVGLVNSIDVDALIEAGSKPLETKSSKPNTFPINRIAKKKHDLTKKKRKAQKLKKFLATHDVNGTIDPERWLPLRDRSTYRPKKKQLAKQTQGVTMSKKAEQALDMSKKKSTKAQASKKATKKKGRK